MQYQVPAVDLTNCDREPIHLLGAIQPIGFLISLTSDWMIARVSANIADFLGRSPDELIASPLQDFCSASAIHDLRNRASLLRSRDSVERLFSCRLVEGGGLFDVVLYISDRNIVLEAEPSTAEHGDVTGLVRSMVSRLDQTEDMTAFFREGARQIRAVLGHDRVMVYRFAEDGSGEVVAEAVKGGIGRFLGLHYPASDIPAQARELYRRNLLRLIADIDAVPVPVVPQLDQDGKPIDLSLSTLRSVSPIHIEYLRNMGVRASLSISIIVDGRLWGLFACHHYSPHHAGSERRARAELFAQMFAMRLESRIRKETVEYERRARDISDQLLGAVASDEMLLKDPEWLNDILTNAIPADGVGVWLSGNYALSGATPPPEAFKQIVRNLGSITPGKVFTTSHLGGFIEGAEAYASDAAGMLVIPISRSPRDYVVLFRREIIHSVRWGGDPRKPVEFGPNGPRLTPRASFDEWRELVEGRSRPFTTSEVRVAETLRATLIEVVLRMADEASAERLQFSARQELLIAELNHRVRNILGLIRGLIRQSGATARSIDDFVKVVDGRIHALARAHNQITDDHWGPAPLQALIDAEAAAFADRDDRIHTSGDPIFLSPTAYSTMALVVHELVTNSLKYGSLSVREGSVSLDWYQEVDQSLVIEWQERNGPPVREPERKGFGTTIISRSVPYDLGGKAEVVYSADGFRARFVIPARHMAEPRPAPNTRAVKYTRPSAGHPQAAPDQVLAGHDVLLVEDSLIIALDAEDIAERLGAVQVTTAATVEGALDALDRGTPTVAILDINLGDKTSFMVADRLADLGVPFIFATGYGEQACLPDSHAHRLVVQKPYTIENIATVMSGLTEPLA